LFFWLINFFNIFKTILTILQETPPSIYTVFHYKQQNKKSSTI
jgi:hypothetical protein